MTQKDKRYLQDKLCHERDKELLLKDLCARLPYKLYVEDEYGDIVCLDYTDLHFENYFNAILEGNVKPYLFPLSSMTEKQNDSWRDAWFPDLMTSTDVNYPESEKYLAVSHAKSLDWLYKNHIDIYGFIPKGLAIDATGLDIYQ